MAFFRAYWDGVQQMISQRVTVLQHLNAEDGLFRRHTLPWQIGRFGGKIRVVYPVGAEGAAVELLSERAQEGVVPADQHLGFRQPKIIVVKLPRKAGRKPQPRRDSAAERFRVAAAEKGTDIKDALHSFFRKLAQGVGPSFGLVLMVALGYNEQLGATQPFEVALKMRYLVAALYLAGAVLQFIGAKLVYNLDKKTLAQMETELKAKRG